MKCNLNLLKRMKEELLYQNTENTSAVAADLVYTPRPL